MLFFVVLDTSELFLMQKQKKAKSRGGGAPKISGGGHEKFREWLRNRPPFPPSGGPMI